MALVGTRSGMSDEVWTADIRPSRPPSPTAFSISRGKSVLRVVQEIPFPKCSSFFPLSPLSLSFCLFLFLLSITGSTKFFLSTSGFSYSLHETYARRFSNGKQALLGPEPIH